MMSNHSARNNGTSCPDCGIVKGPCVLALPAFHPQQDRMLVVPEPKDDSTTHGGIVVPGTATAEVSPYRVGRVLIVGPGRRAPDGVSLLSMNCKPRDRVMFHKNAAHHVILDGVFYDIIGNDDVVAKLATETSFSQFVRVRQTSS